MSAMPTYAMTYVVYWPEVARALGIEPFEERGEDDE